MDENSLRLLLAQDVSVEEIGRRFGRDASTVSYWMKKYGLEAPHREAYAAKGGIDREVLEAHVVEGRSIAEIAQAVERGKGTVRYWLRVYGLRTQAGVRTREAAEARAAGIFHLDRECARHGPTSFAIEGRGYYRCRRCRSEQVSGHRRARKAALVEEAGGRCVACGYDRCPAALEFHHVDPASKRLGIAAGGLSHSLATLRVEIGKCVLLCSNCHAEVESGVRRVAVE